MFNEEECVVYETRLQSLADVENKIASVKEKGRTTGLDIAEVVALRKK